MTIIRKQIWKALSMAGLKRAILVRLTQMDTSQLLGVQKKLLIVAEKKYPLVKLMKFY